MTIPDDPKASTKKIFRVDQGHGAGEFAPHVAKNKTTQPVKVTSTEADSAVHTVASHKSSPPVFDQLQQLLSNLEYRLSEIESREEFLVQSLNTLDHERRTFKLEQQLDTQAREAKWNKLRNYVHALDESTEKAPQALTKRDKQYIKQLILIVDEPEPQIPPPHININPQQNIISQQVKSAETNAAELKVSPKNETAQPQENKVVSDHVTGKVLPQDKESNLSVQQEKIPPASTQLDAEEEKQNPPVTAAQQSSLEEFRQQQLSDIERRQKQSLKQIRFQKDHLERIRQEFERERREFLVLSQKIQSQTVCDQEILILRQQQLANLRLLLEEKEESLHREEMILRETKNSLNERESQLTLKFQELNTKVQKSIQKIKKHDQELASQGDVIAARHAELHMLENRLAITRKDVERIHRETITIRQAIDESWKKVKADEHYPDFYLLFQKNHAKLKDLLAIQTVRFEEDAESIEKMREAVRKEHALMIDEMNHKLKEIRQVLMEQHENVGMPKQPVSIDINKERTQWLEERLEAERIIRELISRMEDMQNNSEPGAIPFAA